ncbi:hypothetical protein [Vampirovibrio sp.]|uniref:hypothetical protein n=1 Tax=Vampirovibrio sp. TaxID=2717857 RepID=UPI00359377F7
MRFDGSPAGLEQTDRFIRTAPDSKLLANHGLQLRKLQTHAEMAAKLTPNYSGRHYGALVVLADGTEGMSTNLEASRQVSLCDLRLALGAARNRWIESKVGSPSGSLQVPEVQTIYLVNANLDGDQPIPCADCQEWLASPLCPPDTRVISLERGAGATDPIIRTRTVRQMLPLYKDREPPVLTTTRPLKTLPVSYSPLAQNVVARSETALSDKQVKTLVLKAQQAFQQNQSLAKDSGLAAGASVLLHPSGLITEAGRVDWSTRWQQPADLTAAAIGLARCNGLPETAKPSWRQWFSGGRRQLPPESEASQSIQAVAYYGNDSGLPPITSLGRMARKRGSAQTLVITVEQSQIQVRTVKDFIPELYRA